MTTLMLYFAYGSNMHAAQMKERCPSAKFVCRGKLPSHRLAFTLRSRSRRCGVADILRDETKEVWGIVYELLENELENLDKDEDSIPDDPTTKTSPLAKITTYGARAMRNGRSSLHSIAAIRSPTRRCPIANTKTLLSQVQNTGSYPPSTFKSSSPSKQDEWRGLLLQPA
jgi:hypothetical protein